MKTEGSSDMILLIYDNAEFKIFIDTTRYFINMCTSDTEPFKNAMPAGETPIIWEFVITATDATVYCNYLKVIDYTFGGGGESCSDYWGSSSKELSLPKGNAINKYNLDPSTWTDIQKGLKTMFSLNKQPLRIQTVDAAGSDTDIIILIYSGSKMVKLSIQLIDPIVVTLSEQESCNDSKRFTLPTDAQEPLQWNLVVTHTSLRIRYDGKEVYNYEFPGECLNRTADIWAIEFSSLDTASLKYVAEKCDSAPAGFYLEELNSECHQCAGNTFSVGNTMACDDCPAGEISTEDHSQCDACPKHEIRELGESECHECDGNGKQPNGKQDACGEFTKYSNITEGTINNSSTRKCIEF